MSNDTGSDVDPEVLDLVLPSTLDAIRIDRVLSMLTGLSRAETSEMLLSGAVRLDGKLIEKSSVLVHAGQHLVALLPVPESEYVQADPEVPVDVVLDDDDFCVVNKAPGQVVHPGAGQRAGTLVAGLLARYPEMSSLSAEGLCDPSRPGIVHRLDKGTSGLLVVAKTPEGYANLSAQMSGHSIERIYLGMVEGHVPEERGVVDAPIGRSTRTPTMMSVRGDGRAARTHYDVITRIERPSAMTLLRLQLDTGRTHQIRVHMATIGHPVVNDARYGHRREHRLEVERFFLHSTTLTFTHPRRDERVTAHVDLPDDLAALVPEGVEF